MSRRQQWKDEPWKFSPLILPAADDDPLQAAWEERAANPQRTRSANDFNSYDLTRYSKEIIYFTEEDGSSGFAHVVFAIDMATAELVVEEVLAAIDLDHQDVLMTLAIAHSHGVPVVPDTDDLAPELEAWERELFTEGLTADFDGRSDVRLVLSKYADVDADSLDALDVVARTEPISPSEAHLLLTTARRELGVLESTKRALDSLRSGIDEMATLLSAAGTDEHHLQRCLTRHPILFGPEYIQMHPKYRLGGDYEMDFALQRGSGLIDLVEIEAASRLLFTKSSQPRADLVVHPVSPRPYALRTLPV